MMVNSLLDPRCEVLVPTTPVVARDEGNDSSFGENENVLRRGSEKDERDTRVGLNRTVHAVVTVRVAPQLDPGRENNNSTPTQAPVHTSPVSGHRVLRAIVGRRAEGIFHKVTTRSGIVFQPQNERTKNSPLDRVRRCQLFNGLVRVRGGSTTQRSISSGSTSRVSLVEVHGTSRMGKQSSTSRKCGNTPTRRSGLRPRVSLAGKYATETVRASRVARTVTRGKTNPVILGSIPGKSRHSFQGKQMKPVLASAAPFWRVTRLAREMSKKKTLPLITSPRYMSINQTAVPTFSALPPRESRPRPTDRVSVPPPKPRCDESWLVGRLREVKGTSVLERQRERTRRVSVKTVTTKAPNPVSSSVMFTVTPPSTFRSTLFTVKTQQQRSNNGDTLDDTPFGSGRNENETGSGLKKNTQRQTDRIFAAPGAGWEHDD